MGAALARFCKAIADAVRPDEILRPSEWAARDRVLPPDTPEPGPWRNERAPYLVDIADTMGTGSRFTEGWNKKGHQIGGSAAGENFVGAAICGAAGSMLVVFASIEDAKQWEVQRFEPMRKFSPGLRKRIKGAGLPGSKSTKLRKRYAGGVMRLVSANRVGGLKSATMRYLKFEEPDEYVKDLKDQGNPIALALKRKTNFGARGKAYGDGTPTIKDRSAIDFHFQRGDQRRWHVPCPGCRHFQPFEWERFKWEGDAPDEIRLSDRWVRFYCKQCGEGFTETQWKVRSYAWSPGMTNDEAREAGLAHWRATAKGEPGVASWHSPSMLAPIGWRPWNALAVAYESAEKAERLGDAQPMKEFWNNERGDVWATSLSAKFSAQAIRDRAGNYPQMQCPAGGLVVVASVDTQDSRLAVEIRAYGRGEQSWGLHHSEIPGSPASSGVWSSLRALLEAPIAHVSGHPMRVEVAFIDAGGHFDAEVKIFCRDAQARGQHWCAIRGAPDPRAVTLGKPRVEEINHNGKPIPGGAIVRYVGTQKIKHLLHNRIAKIEKQGPGYVHWPQYASEYFDQMVAERMEYRRDRFGNSALVWVSTGARNEAWDLMVYGYAAYLYAVSGKNTEQVFAEREGIFALPRVEIKPEDLPPAPVVSAWQARGRGVRSPGMGAP